MILYTIGTQGHNAESFFRLLNKHSIERVIDIRRRNTAQVCGVFTRSNLEYLVPLVYAPDECTDGDPYRSYEHRLDLAPPLDLLLAWRHEEVTWKDYTAEMERHLIDANPVYCGEDGAFRTCTVLLCSEHDPEHCHRSIVAQWVKDTCPHDVEVVDL